jgi:ubiquitin-conjugating enzyme E2 J1
MLTPSGRFQTNKKICLSISGFHPEHWRCVWSIRTVLIALIAFLPTKGGGAIGALDYSSIEKKRYAKLSQQWYCKQCELKNCEQLAPERSATAAAKKKKKKKQKADVVVDGLNLAEIRFAPEKPKEEEEAAATTTTNSEAKVAAANTAELPPPPPPATGKAEEEAPKSKAAAAPVAMTAAASGSSEAKAAAGAAALAPLPVVVREATTNSMSRYIVALTIIIVAILLRKLVSWQVHRESLQIIGGSQP